MQPQVRLFLLFFVTSLWSFEWQAILGKPEQIGDLAGPRIALLMSLGSVLLVSLSWLSPNLLPKKNNTILAFVAGLALGNLMLAWTLGHGFDGTVRGVVYLTLILNAIVGHAAIATETASIVKSSKRLEFVRPFGSLGFLAAALLSQKSNGSLLYLAIGVPVLIGFLHSGIQSTDQLSKPDEKRSIGLSFPLIISVAMLLGFVARGFDAAVTQELREQNPKGLLWLVIMIASEILFLLFSQRLNSRFIILFSPVAWMIAYYCFQQPADDHMIVIGMIFVGLNCTWQTKLASSTEISEGSDLVYRQYLLASGITVGGLVFTCIPHLIGLQSLHDIIRFSSISAAATTAIVAILFVPRKRDEN
jgi:hypothetical protein